ncbi:MAG: glycosyl transferase [Rhodospirillales bacterium]|nr:glycosyl transferase [Rhodospirillales bacterium]
MTRHDFTLSIVIPVYRGAQTVGPLVEALSALDVPGGHEIILVNDGSPDDSLAVCRELMRKSRLPLTVIDLARNFGEHNAVMAGLQQARGAWIITMDDDLQNPPSEVLRLLEYAQRSGREAIYTRFETKEHAAWRNLGSRFTNRVADVLLDKPKGLYLSSFRCISAFVAANVVRYAGPFPYVDGLVLQVTQSIDCIEVKHLPRTDGRSTYTLRRLIRLWLNMFINFSVMPLRLSTLTGIALSIVGALASVEVLAEAMIRSTPPGWGSLMAAVLLLSGVQLLILGLVGEYLGRLYLTMNGKPQFIVKEVERSDAAQGSGETVPTLAVRRA